MSSTSLHARLCSTLALGALFAAIPALLFSPAARASDHADPIDLDRLEGGITDLFVFPAKDMARREKRQVKKDQPEESVAITSAESNRLIIVFCVRRALTASPPFEGLDQFTY